MAVEDAEFQIDGKLVERADRCQRGNPCLGGGEGLHCQVRFSVQKDDDHYIFIECREDDGCSYRLTFGQTHVCTCPVRAEIYRKYSV